MENSGTNGGNIRKTNLTSLQQTTKTKVLETYTKAKITLRRVDHRLKEAYDSIRRKLLYSILTEMDISMKLVMLIKMFRMYMLPS